MVARQQGDGSSVKAHLEIAAEWGSATAIKVLTEAPELPKSVEYLWWWFCELSSRRGGGFVPAPLTFRDIESWARVTGAQPNHWEVGIILRLDDDWLSSEAEYQLAEIEREKRGKNV